MMPKKKPSDTSPLSQYWVPPEYLVESGVGQPRVCLATTFEFEAAFFEAELLPRFLGLRFDHTENERTFLVEREDALAVAKVVVLVDQSRFDATQTTLRWDQLAVRVPGGIQHAKIAVLAWERFVRVIVGSANLNLTGYRRNREVFAPLDFWDADDSVPLDVLRETLDLLGIALGWARVAPAVQDRTREAIEQVRRLAKTWETAPSEFTAREHPRVTLAATHPASSQFRARSTLGEIVKRWGNRRATSVTVVTPFVGQAQGSQRDPVVEKLMTLPRSRECDAWLVVPESPQTAEDGKSRVEIPQSFVSSWADSSQNPRSAYVLPLPLCVVGEEDRNRNLHSKAVMLESNDDVLLMIGSSNFTPHGMGVGVHNLEANLVFEDRAASRPGGVGLLDRLPLPRDWRSEAVDATAVIGLDALEPPEDAADPKRVLPPFFAWAVYSQQTGVLQLGLDRSQSEPAAWSVRLPGTTEDAGLLLFSGNLTLAAAGDLSSEVSAAVGDPRRAEGAASPACDVLTYEFAKDARGVNIVAVLVEWTDAAGQTQQTRLGVCVENREDMPPPSEYRKLSANAIIECLMSGRSPAEWVDRQRRGGRGSSNEAAIESLRAVDTSGYLLYRIRQFARALTGMGERILGTVPHPEAIRYRLLQDPFGPVSLATSLLEPGGGAAQNWCARLETEHRVFLLTEILLAVHHLRQRFSKSTRGKERTQLLAPFEVAESRLVGLLDEHVSGSSDGLPGNLKGYVEAVRSRLRRSVAGNVAGDLRSDDPAGPEPHAEPSGDFAGDREGEALAESCAAVVLANTETRLERSDVVATGWDAEAPAEPSAEGKSPGPTAPPSSESPELELAPVNVTAEDEHAG
jgi:hypothetical protein